MRERLYAHPVHCVRGWRTASFMKLKVNKMIVICLFRKPAVIASNICEYILAPPSIWLHPLSGSTLYLAPPSIWFHPLSGSTLYLAPPSIWHHPLSDHYMN